MRYSGVINFLRIHELKKDFKDDCLLLKIRLTHAATIPIPPKYFFLSVLVCQRKLKIIFFNFFTVSFLGYCKIAAVLV
jgi:hypothetical protein